MTDQRHQKRIELMQALFACTFTPERIESCLLDPQCTVKDILSELPEIDVLLQKVAPERPLSEINKVDLAILRLIMFESKHKKTPPLVLINEAVEIAKAIGSDTSPKFVNGVLAKLLIN